jgi:hypothetical protein
MSSAIASDYMDCLLLHPHRRAVIALQIEDVYMEQCRIWLRLREKGGKADVASSPMIPALLKYGPSPIDPPGESGFDRLGRRFSSPQQTQVATSSKAPAGSLLGQGP